MAAGEIEIYTTMFCPYCAGAKQLLGQKNVAYKEIAVDGKPELRRAMAERAAGRSSVPQIFFGDHHVGGCDELYALEKAGELDELLRRQAVGTSP